MNPKINFHNSIALIVVFSIFSFACSSGTNKEKQETNTSDKLLVSVVNNPLYYFASEIGSEFVDVYMPETDDDPAYWNPTTEGISKFQKADLILLNGAGYAKWINDISLPSINVVNTSEAFQDDYIVLEEGSVHSHGPEGDHSHKGYAFTTWLDPNNALMQAEAIKEALVKKMPEKKEILGQNFEALKTSLIQLDNNLSNSFSGYNGLEVFASHPVYQYLGKRFDLNIISYHWEPNQMPSEDDWKEFENELDHHTARIMLWEDEPLPEIRNKMENMGISVVVYNPGGNKVDVDFLSLMNHNAANLNLILK